jgi:3-hydroxy-9,10-secoandrosta-1,3,5(10)-triene-9,17-dione monooxygenase
VSLDPVTGDELVARADELRPRLVELQAETEARTYYSEEIHQAFLEARFYDVLGPKRYGGLELDLGTFWRLGMALARGCPSTAWCLCLPAGHALQTGMLFPEDVQAELFGGLYICPAVAAPAGSAKRVEGGWELTSTHPYSSGAPYATHYMGQTFAAPEQEGGPPQMLLFVAPRESWTMLDDWGDTLGLKGSGSHSVRFEQAFIPERFVLENTWLVDTDVAGTPGAAIHGNSMYAGRTLAYFEGSLAAIMIGAAKGALDEYEELLRTRKTQRPPIVTRSEDPDYQRWYGLAVGRVGAAEAILLQVAEQWHEACRRSVEDGVPFTREEDLRLNMVAREALTLAWEAMQGEIFRTAGSSAARAGQRIERIFRDMSIGWGHFGQIVRDWTAREWSREHFGLVEDVLKPDRLHRS